VVVEHHAQRRHESRVVLQRFAHAHHYDIRDGAFAVGEIEAFAQMMFGEPELRHDLAGGEIAAEALVSGGAETATHSATRLR